MGSGTISEEDISHRHILPLCCSITQVDLFGSLFKCWVKRENWFLACVVSDSFTNPGGSRISSWAKYAIFLRVPCVWMLNLYINLDKLHSLGTLCASAIRSLCVCGFLLLRVLVAQTHLSCVNPCFGTASWMYLGTHLTAYQNLCVYFSSTDPIVLCTQLHKQIWTPKMGRRLL